MRQLIRAVAAFALAGAVGAAPSLASPAPAAPKPAAAASNAALVHAPLEAAPDASLPPEARAARDALLQRLGGAEHLRENPGRAFIDGSAYQCAPTVFHEWLARSMAVFSPADRQLMAALDIDALTTYDALLFGSSDDPAYALLADAQRLTRTARTTRTFWDVDLSGVQVLAMRGSMLTDTTRVARVYREVYGLDAATAAAFAQVVAEFIGSSPAFEGGDHPYFTLNAFAFTNFGQPLPGIGTVPDKIVMGDGILRAYRELGYGDVAPQAILAHEFAHHVQFQTGMITPDTASTPSTTRRTELHADALAGYYLSHPRGESMQWKRVQQFLGVFFSIGDCRFDSAGHHGTPNQRMRAAQWGYEQQLNARPRGHIAGTAALTRDFDAALPQFVRPDT